MENKILIVDDEKMIYSALDQRLSLEGYACEMANIGEVIPLEARIIAVADSFDAMTSLRPHRKALPVHQVVDEMEKEKGRQFDPNITEVFLKERIYDASRMM